jgi:hypothetical protein
VDHPGAAAPTLQALGSQNSPHSGPRHTPTQMCTHVCNPHPDTQLTHAYYKQTHICMTRRLHTHSYMHCRQTQLCAPTQQAFCADMLVKCGYMLHAGTHLHSMHNHADMRETHQSQGCGFHATPYQKQTCAPTQINTPPRTPAYCGQEHIVTRLNETLGASPPHKYRCT